jgi:serine/threonine protein kinase
MYAAFNHPTLVRLWGYAPYSCTDGVLSGGYIIDYSSENGYLNDMIQKERRETAPREWDDTARLIVLYGTAVGMMIMHSHNAIHRNLNPFVIGLDNNLEPKIGGFAYSKFLDPDDPRIHSMHGGTPIFMAPEISKGGEYGIEVDVFAFGILVYRAVTRQAPFKGATAAGVARAYLRGGRPKIPIGLNSAYEKLITDCWKHDEYERPTFEDIVGIIGSNPSSFGNIDEDRFRRYEAKILPVNRMTKLIQDLVSEEIDRRNEPPIVDDISTFVEQCRLPPIRVAAEAEQLEQLVVTIGDFERVSEICTHSYEYRDPKSNETQLVKVSLRRLSSPADPDFDSEIKQLASFKHQTIVSLRGYQPCDKLHNGDWGAILTDFMPNGSIADVVDGDWWNDTRKLIVSYGVAVGMLILHANNVIHLNVQPSAILLDGDSEPKLAEFCFARVLDRELVNPTGLFEEFTAPEVLSGGAITLAADVWSYGSLLSSMMTDSEESPVPGSQGLLPAGYKSLIRKCCAKLPNKRPSFVDIVRTLEKPSRLFGDVDRELFGADRNKILGTVR